MKTIIFGNNSFKTHKRGVENVILTQIELYNNSQIYYFHWGNVNSIYKYKNIICISLKNSFNLPIVLNYLLFKIKKINFIHSHNPLFTFFSFFKTNIFTLHDGLYYLAKSKKSKKSSIYFLIELLLYTRIKKIHFISHYSKKESLFWGKKKYAIIYNSSHLENIFSIDKTKSLKHNYFLIVKGIEERSRIDLIIETAKINQDEHFIIVGRGPLLNFYKEEIRIKSLKNIEMLGYVEDQELIILYQNAKCVLNIAEYGEGFGLPIIEAYLFNKPVLASNNCAIPEIIYNKDFLFDNTIESINNKIKKYSNEFLNLDKNYRNYYFSMFSKKVILEKKKKFIEC